MTVTYAKIWKKIERDIKIIVLKYYRKLASIGSLTFSVGHNLQLVLFVMGIYVIFIEKIIGTSRRTQR